MKTTFQKTIAISLFVIGILTACLIPTKNEAILIMAGGKAMDYVQSDTSFIELLKIIVMKVICIDAKPRGVNKEGLELVEEGGEYIVTDINGNGGYYLYGINYRGCGYAYAIDRFIPLSSIDEKEDAQRYADERFATQR